jgi:hypothetical protein
MLTPVIGKSSLLERRRKQIDLNNFNKNKKNLVTIKNATIYEASYIEGGGAGASPLSKSKQKLDF